MQSHNTASRLGSAAAIVAAISIALLLALLPTARTAEAQEPVSVFTVVGTEDGSIFTFEEQGDEVIATFSNDEVRRFPRSMASFDLGFVEPLAGYSVPALGFTWGVEGGPRITEVLQPSDAAPPLAAGNTYIGEQAGSYAFISSLDDGCVGVAEFEILELEFDAFGNPIRAAIDYFAHCAGSRVSLRLNSAVPLDTMTSISGTVTAKDTGALLSDIGVCAFTGPGEERFCATTNSIGRYTISGFPEGLYGVEFFDGTGRGYAGECFPAVVGCDRATGLQKSEFINVSSAIDAALSPGCFFSIATVIGTDNDDDLVGTPGYDVFVGYRGDDTIDGRGGNDIVCAGFGNDVIDLGDGNHDVVAGIGADQITVGNGTSWIAAGPGGDVITTGEGDQIIYGDGGNDVITTGAGDDVIYGGGGNDVVEAGDGANLIFGQGGADLLRGGAGPDEMYGGPGYDTLWGEGDIDFLNAGGGNDTIWGGGGADNMYGKAGNDTMYGQSGFDQMYGAGGDDTMFGGQGNDRIQGAAGDDRLEGGTGNDVLYGQADDDTMVGDDGNDTLYAAAGNDALSGGPGNDNLQAGGGDDDLDGGPGTDILYGQSGINTLDGGDDTDQCFPGGTGSTTAACE